uniref:Uncharacterized protein n=1 Tax=Cacopsylla melanoneura TaxID=428564 RepID=A0A8D8TW02_9HEMI
MHPASSPSPPLFRSHPPSPASPLFISISSSIIPESITSHPQPHFPRGAFVVDVFGSFLLPSIFFYSLSHFSLLTYSSSLFPFHHLLTFVFSCFRTASLRLIPL